MTTDISCNLVQERIVAGEPLDETGQAHVLACAECSRCAAECLALDSAIAEGLDGGAVVPEGFADQVMSHLEDAPETSSRLNKMLGRRWVQLALAHVGVAVALVNLMRFVFSTLVPVASLGGGR
jgi:hypothetical protein